MVLKNIFILAVVNTCLLLLYMFDWVFADIPWNFLVFVIALAIFILLNLYAVYLLFFKREYMSIIIILIGVFMLTLPLKKFYVMLEYRLNLPSRMIVVELYKKKELIPSKEKLFGSLQQYQVPTKYKYFFNTDKKIIYANDKNIVFPIFHYTQIILYSKDPKTFFVEYGYRKRLKLGKKWYWATKI